MFASRRTAEVTIQALPSGTRWVLPCRHPSDKSLGYYRMSLRDEKGCHETRGTLRLPAPEGQSKIAQHFSSGNKAPARISWAKREANCRVVQNGWPWLHKADRLWIF